MRRNSLRHWPLARLAGLAFGVTLLARTLGAQPAISVTEDAGVLDAWQTRIRLLPTWSGASRQYRGTMARPFGAPVSFDPFGVQQLPMLAPVEADIRAVSAMSLFALSLGQATVHAESRSTITPIVLDVGLTNRIMLSLTVPYVMTNTDVLLGANRTPGSGTVGVNPGLTAGVPRNANTALRNGITQAAAQLEAALAACLITPGAGSCPTLNARRPAAQALIDASRAFRDIAERIYGSDTASGALVVPLALSVTQLAIENRVRVFNADYRDFLALAPASPDPIGAFPFPAQTPLTVAQMQSVYTDAAYGFRYEPVVSRSRSHIGDVEGTAKILIIDGLRPGTLTASGRVATPPSGYRLALSVTGRFPTGAVSSPDRLLDPQTGDRQTDIAVGITQDIMSRGRLGATILGSYTNQLPDRPIARVPVAAGGPLVPIAQEIQVDRDLGDEVSVQILPRYRSSETITTTAIYAFRYKEADRYTGTVTVGAIPLDASVLNTGTSQIEHRVGFGVTYSTVAAANRGETRIPVDIAAAYVRTIAGRHVPQLAQAQFEFRLYAPRRLAR